MSASTTGLPPDRAYPSSARLDGAQLTNEDIRAFELERARHALAYLKGKLGNDALREVLAPDLAAMTDQVRGWVEASQGQWQSAEVELVVPGPGAREFFAWYTNAMTNTQEEALRAGHPEHFVVHPRPDGTEVIENIGETERPWRVLYHSLPERGPYPVPWDPDSPVRFGAELLDVQGLRVGYTMHALRDAPDGTHIRMTSSLPAAAPVELLERHRHHLLIEFRNWARAAQLWVDAGGAGDFGSGLHAPEPQEDHS